MIPLVKKDSNIFFFTYLFEALCTPWNFVRDKQPRNLVACYWLSDWCYGTDRSPNNMLSVYSVLFKIIKIMISKLFLTAVINKKKFVDTNRE